MGRRRKNTLPAVRVTDHGGRMYARVRVGGTTHHLGRVYDGCLSQEQIAVSDAICSGGIPWSVYVVSDGHGNFKIGIAQDAAHRLSQLQTGNASLLSIVYIRLFSSESAARSCESHCHASLQSCAIHGEWFRCSEWAARDAVSGFAVEQEAFA